MPITEREAATKASPEVVFGIWKQLNWESWDPDVTAVTSEGAFEDGTALLVQMTNGKTHKATLHDVVENHSFSYSAKVPGGTMVAEHVVEGLPSGGSTIVHRFGFGGFLGGVYSFSFRKMVSHGLEAGLAALVEICNSRKFDPVYAPPGCRGIKLGK